MTQEPIRFAAVGDCFITRRLPENDVRAAELRSLLREADVRFANLETTVHQKEGTPSAFSGGTWAMADPGVLTDLKYYGFNLFNAATNHSLDYLYDGLEATERYLKQEEMTYAGIGPTLADAAAPAYVETTKGRAALIAATSTFHPSWAAGYASRTMKGRPGVNPLHLDTLHHIEPEEAGVLQTILSRTDINADHHLAVKEGFETADAEDSLTFGPLRFRVGGRGTVRSVREADRLRMKEQIKAARGSSDVVLVSIHSHEMDGEDKAAPADFHQEAAREWIDAGADAVIGHGPHILRGIEVYQGKPIFYSLGNFIFQNETVSDLPYDFFAKYGMSDSASPAEAFDTRSHGGKGLAFHPGVWESVVPFWEMQHGKLTRLELHPIDLGGGQPRSQRGWPGRTRRTRPVETMQELSRPFGTVIDIQEDGTGIVRLS
ncbi:CapA family protein [Alkalicoccus urumqiensis]|uniref:Capsule biosynthesis protein n=1 Tax=Alkalicoccus urumqiensis TaxID=1548213 RepID=A0A2P6MLZ7_ALKUR|nr:CapA family protein [Alkalicoccus urumqiensis]PRO67278.1 capsule biosynthesis protein [Alkalicoccus urumqiensis]